MLYSDLARKPPPESAISNALILENTAESPSASWYLHPLVARQKREVILEWTSRWLPRAPGGLLLKTDLFEEANGDDTLLPCLLGAARPVAAFDWLPPVAARARRRLPDPGLLSLAADCRALPFRSGSVSVALSLSTLDHSADPADFEASISEMARVLRPGGLLLVTLDNPLNPLYWLLRLLSRMGRTPFPLGYTPPPPTLDRRLTEAGFEVLGRDWLIHNPRLLSTALFVSIERALGRRGDPLVRFLLFLFTCLGRLPVHVFSACFFATCARRRGPEPAG